MDSLEPIKDDLKSGSTEAKPTHEISEDELDSGLFDDFVYQPRQYGLLTTPVFDIFKIILHSKEAKDVTNHTKCLCDGHVCTICGIVQVHDEEMDARYVVYEMKEPETEPIGSDGVLSITGFPVIRFAKFLKISVSLSCTAHSTEIANGSFVLDYRGAFKYNQFSVDHVYGKHGYASVNHITFQHANVAIVNRLCISKYDNEIDDVDLFGTIVAHLERPHGKHTQIELFNNANDLKQAKHGAVNFNSDIKLCRSSIVIPASCSLKVKAEFHDNSGEPVLTQDISLVVESHGLQTERVLGKSFEMEIQISWPACYEVDPRERKVEANIDAKQIFTQDLKAINFPPTEAELRCDPLCAHPFNFSSFVEIFSVLLCVEEEHIGEIRGSIKLKDGSDNICCIFEGSENCSRHKTLTIGCHAHIFEFNQNNGCEIDCDLRDGQDRVVGKGVVLWSAATRRGYFDRHLCSVLKGDIGYVAIHHSLFDNSMQARIRVTFVATNEVMSTDSSFEVGGKISAWYGSYNYCTSYDQEFYSVTLYSKTKEDCFRAKMNFDLPLSRSFIVLPSQDILFLNVSLRVQNARDMTFEDVEETIEFKPYAHNLFVIGKTKYDISVCVEWSNDKEPKPFSNSTIPYKRSLLKAKSKTRRS